MFQPARHVLAVAGWSTRSRRRIPGRDDALRISVLGEEPDLVAVQRQRIGVELLSLGSSPLEGVWHPWNWREPDIPPSPRAAGSANGEGGRPRA